MVYLYDYAFIQNTIIMRTYVTIPIRFCFDSAYLTLMNEFYILTLPSIYTDNIYMDKDHSICYRGVIKV